MTVRFGMVFDPTGDLDQAVKIAVEAERKGLDSVLLADHYMSRWTDEKFDVWPLLAFLAAKTKRVRLGTGVTPMTLRHPVVLAKLVMAVDAASKGRAVLGAGIGWNEREFNAFGLGWDDFKVRAEKAREAIEVVLKVWTEEKVNYSGKYYALKDAVCLPRTFQKPHPPVWWGGNSKSAIRLAATYGQGWIPIRISVEAYREGVKVIKKQRLNEGRNEPFIFGYTGPAILAKSLGEAKRLVPPVEREQGANVRIIGDPKTSVEIIKRYVDCGCNYVAPLFTSVERTMEQLELFTEEIIPALNRV